MTTVAGLPAASSVASADEIPISQDASGVNTLREASVAQIALELAGTGLTAVSGQLEVNTAQVAAALAGSGLTVVNGQLVASTGETISSVVVSTSTLSAGSQATGSGSVSGNVLTLNLGIPAGATGAAGSGGSGGSSGISVTTIATSGAAQVLTFPSSGGSAYEITLSANCNITLAGGTAGQFQTMTVRYNQPSGGGFIPTYATPVEWAYGTSPAPNSTAGRFDVIQYSTFGDGVYFGSVVGLGIVQPNLTVAAPSTGLYPGNVVLFTGSYAGSAPTNIDYSFNNSTWTTSSPAATIANNGYSFEITVPSAGSYILYVRETNANGITSNVAFTSAVTAPAAPTVVATAGAGQVSLAITPSANTGGSAILTYNINRSTTSGAETLLTSVSVSNNPYVDTSVTGGTEYFYTVQAVNAGGTSAASLEVNGTPTASTVPAAPTITASAGVGQNVITITAGANGGSAVTSNLLYRSTTSGSETLYQTLGSGVLSYTDSSVTVGTEYFYKWAQVNANGTGTLSAEANATPVASITVPGAPTIVVTAGILQNSIAITPGSTGGATITNYGIYRSTTSGAETLLTTAAATSPYVDTGLTAGVEYFYKVTAINSAGASAQSAEANGTPTASSAHYLSVNGGSATITDSAATTAGFSATTSLLDLQIKVQLSTYTPSNSNFLLSKWGSAPANQQYVFLVTTTGALQFVWRGSTSTEGSYTAATTLGAAGLTAGTPIWLRCVANPATSTQDGYAAQSATFYYSTNGSTWTSLGGTSGGGSIPTSIWAGTSPNPFSISGNTSNQLWSGEVFAVNVYVNQVIALATDFTAQTTGATTLTSGTGPSWTVVSPATEV